MADETIPPPPLRQLPWRVGQLATAPDAALARVDAEGGGLRDALALVAAAVVAFRMPELIQAVLIIAGGASGAFMRLVSLFASEAQHAAWFVLPAAVVVTLLAGDRRDSGRDLDLAAACYPPVFVAAGLERALAELMGPHPMSRSLADAAAAVAVALLVFRAVRIARARPRAAARATAAGEGAEAPPAPAPDPSATAAPVAPPSGRGARLVGGAVVALALALAAHGAVWSARNLAAL